MPGEKSGKLPSTVLSLLVGKTIQSIEGPYRGDDGVLITFTDGSWLEVSYSGGEGKTSLIVGDDILVVE